jgi:hypothetical protein
VRGDAPLRYDAKSKKRDAIIVGLSLVDWRAMTPTDWSQHVAAWNQANAGETTEPPTWEQFQELKKKYGD